jgi:inosine-uridine nucleoside N-ribohydrolase
MSIAKRSFLIVDTDVGFDDFVALQCLLNTKNATLVTTIGGVVDAHRGAQALRTLFPQASIARGLDAPAMPYDPMPDWLINYRTSSFDGFVQSLTPSWTSQNQESSRSTTTNQEEALSKVVDLIDRAPEDSLDILCIGPLTNLAHWLHHYSQTNQLDLLQSKLHRIYILGGNHPLTPQPTEPEFNFGLDPDAAKTVLESNILRDKLHLMTSSVSNRDSLEKGVGKMTLEDFIEAQKTSQPKTPFFPALLQFDAWAYCLSCDPVCAFALDHPQAVTHWEEVSVQVQVPSGLLLPAAEVGKNKTVIRIAEKIQYQGCWARTSKTLGSEFTRNYGYFPTKLIFYCFQWRTLQLALSLSF